MLKTLLFIGFLLAIDLYVFQAFKFISENRSSQFQKGVAIAYWSISAIALICVLLSRIYDYHLWPKDIRVYFFAFIFILYFSKLFVVLFLLIDDIVRLTRVASKLVSKFALGNAEEVISTGRLKFFSQVGLIIASIPFFSLLSGIILGPYRFRKTKTDVAIRNLPPAFQNLKIVQISDLHLGSWKSDEPLNEAFAMIMEEKPDLIFFTGDLVNDFASEAEPYVSTLQKLKAPLGVYSVLGNHDYGDYFQWPDVITKSKNLVRLKEIHGEAGWKLLLNENVFIEKDGEKIALIGVENLSASNRFHSYGNLEKAYSGLSPEISKILLSHDPSSWGKMVIPAYPDIDLTLSGHTHGMQFGIEIPGFKWSPVQYVYKQWAGLYNASSQNLYVNRGLGFLGYPGRVGIMPEISIFNLKKA